MELRKRKKLEVKSDCVDRISNLPDDCIHRILELSSIDAKTVAQFSLLSKRWRYLPTSLPSICLTNPAYVQEKYEPRSMVAAKKKKQCEDFNNSVNKVLELRRDHKSNIQSFQLDSYYVCQDYRLSSWISQVAMHSVAELRIRTEWKGHKPLELPMCLFDCQTIKVLQLIIPMKSQQVPSYPPVELETLIIPNTFTFSQLRVLHFEKVITKDRDWISEALANSPFLETLIVRSCKIGSLTKLHISSPSLKKLVLVFLTRLVHNATFDLKISTPNLTSLELYGDLSKGNYYLENLTSLAKASIGMDIGSREERESNFRRMMELLRSLSNVKDLSIVEPQPAWPLISFSAASNIITMQTIHFDNLRSLDIRVGVYYATIGLLIKYLLQSSPHIQTLIIERTQGTRLLQSGFATDCDVSQFGNVYTYLSRNTPSLQIVLRHPDCKWLQNPASQRAEWLLYPNLDEVNYDHELEGALDNMKTFEMKNFQATKDELLFLKLLLKHAPVLEEVILKVAKRSICSVNEKMKIRELKKFQHASRRLSFSFLHPETSLEYRKNSF